MPDQDSRAYRTLNKFDHLHGEMMSLSDVARIKPATRVIHFPLLGSVQYTVETMRQAEQGDTVFLTVVEGKGNKRIAIPPAVSDLIARQRDAAARKMKKRAAASRTPPPRPMTACPVCRSKVYISFGKVAKHIDPNKDTIANCPGSGRKAKKL